MAHLKYFVLNFMAIPPPNHLSEVGHGHINLSLYFRVEFREQFREHFGGIGIGLNRHLGVRRATYSRVGKSESIEGVAPPLPSLSLSLSLSLSQVYLTLALPLSTLSPSHRCTPPFSHCTARNRLRSKRSWIALNSLAAAAAAPPNGRCSDGRALIARNPSHSLLSGWRHHCCGPFPCPSLSRARR